MKRPDAVIAGVWRALRPAGRFVGEMGGEGNVAAIRRALAGAMGRRGLDPSAVDPWYFPGLAEYRAKLEAAGFIVRSIELIPRPTPIPGDIADWLQTFAESFLFAVPEGERPRFLAEVADALAPALRRPDGGWVVDYVRLRFAAARPAQ